MSHEQKFKSPTKATDFTIGVIAPDSLQLAVVTSMADETYHETYVNDGNTYTYMRIGGHNIVAAPLPAGSMNNTNTALVFSSLTQSFRNIRAVFLVGVAQGTPDSSRDETDIRKGNIAVVLSVVEYTKGTFTNGGDLEQRSATNPAGKRLKSAVAALDAAMILGEKNADVNQLVIDKASRFADPSKWKRPTKKDVLLGADGKEIVRGEQKNPNRVFYCQGGTSDVKIKNATFRDDLHKKHKILCSDNHTGGVAHQPHIQFLTINGISDYGDNDPWSFYASISAGAYFKILLNYMPAISPDEAAKETPVSDAFVSPIKDKKYQFCVICPELTTAKAVCGKFRRTFADLKEHKSDKNKGYYSAFGTIGKHDVIVAAMEKCNDFQEFVGLLKHVEGSVLGVTEILFAGTAGGAPDPSAKNKDVRIGDVIVSTHKGVIQFDYGTLMSTGEFIAVSQLNTPSRGSLSAVSAIGASIITQGNLPFPKRPAPDVLTSDKGEIKREHREATILTGQIASGNARLEHSGMRDYLQATHNVLCLDTCSAALGHTGMSYLVVQGICHYNDQNAKKDIEIFGAYASECVAVYVAKFFSTR
jgi:nucleoside phosphorylase